MDAILSTPLNHNGSSYRFGAKNIFNCQEKEPGTRYNISGTDVDYGLLTDSRTQKVGRSFFLEMGKRF
ncbi:MAG: hypothetical protein ABH886_02090 [Candidatus Desantisbacteria bacterium]